MDSSMEERRARTTMTTTSHNVQRLALRGPLCARAVQWHPLRCCPAPCALKMPAGSSATSARGPAGRWTVVAMRHAAHVVVYAALVCNVVARVKRIADPSFRMHATFPGPRNFASGCMPRDLDSFLSPFMF